MHVRSDQEERDPGPKHLQAEEEAVRDVRLPVQVGLQGAEDLLQESLGVALSKHKAPEAEAQNPKKAF